jgi:hypothetical protein
MLTSLVSIAENGPKGCFAISIAFTLSTEVEAMMSASQHLARLARTLSFWMHQVQCHWCGNVGCCHGTCGKFVCHDNNNLTSHAAKNGGSKRNTK